MLKTNCIIILINLSACFTVYGQAKISGHITTADSLPVALASISLLSPVDSSVIAYTSSTADGSFSLTAGTNQRELVLKCTHIAKGESTSLIKNEDQMLHIVLDGKPIQMPEVRVEAPLVEVKGDTLSYRLDTFATAKDRTLADVLNKLPGVEVDANGAIKYQGEYISKFYVEGKDLMESRYGVITNAMPNIDVETVDVLKNHQPIRMLEDKIASTETAFNIRLKKSVSLSGRAEIGLGASPLIWNTKLTPMLFTKEVQAVTDLKSNNAGEDLLASYNSITMGSSGFVTDLAKPIRSGESLQTNRPQLPDLKTGTYLDNRSHLFSANVLKDLSNEWEVKFNLDGWHNRIKDIGSQSTKVILETENRQDSITYSENIDNAISDNNLKGSLFFNQNGKTNFLKDHLSFQLNRKVRDNRTDLNTNRLTQEITSPGITVQNSLVGIKAIGPQKDHHLNYKSYLKYLDNDYDYSLQSSQAFLIPQLDIQTTDPLRQLLSQRELETSHEASMRFFHKNWNFDPKIELNTLRSELAADLLNGNSTISLNNNEINRVQTSSSLNVGLKLRRFNFSLSLPFDLTHVNIRTESIEIEKSRLFFQPRLNTYWRISAFWEWVLSGNVGQSFGNIDRVYENIVMNATSFNTYPPDLSIQHHTSATSQWKYGNPLNNINAHLSVSRTDTRRDFIYAETILDNGQRTYELVPHPNSRETTAINTNLGKYLPAIRANILLKSGYNLTSSNSLIQGQMTDNKISNLTLGAKIIYNQINWLGLQYEMSFGTTKSHHIGTGTSYSEANHLFDCFVYLFKDHMLDASLDYYRFKYSGTDNHYPFLDLTYRFSMEKKKLDFEVKWSNVLQNSHFTRLYFNDVQIVESNYTLRPSQLLFSIKFNFR